MLVLRQTLIKKLSALCSEPGCLQNRSSLTLTSLRGRLPMRFPLWESPEYTNKLTLLVIMQHYQKQMDTLEYEEGHRRHGLEYIGILGAHMVEILHAFAHFTQADKSQGTAEAGSRLSKTRPSTQAATSTQQPYSGPNDSCGTQPPVSGGVPQTPPQTDTSEASMATTVPGASMQHEDSSAVDEPLVELADADSIRQYFHQVGIHSFTHPPGCYRLTWHLLM